MTYPITMLGPRAKVPLTIMPIPYGRGRPCKYPLRDMQIGQSFFAPGVQQVTTHRVTSELGFRFTKRTVVEQGVRGVRIWRLS